MQRFADIADVLGLPSNEPAARSPFALVERQDGRQRPRQPDHHPQGLPVLLGLETDLGGKDPLRVLGVVHSFFPVTQPHAAPHGKNRI